MHKFKAIFSKKTRNVIEYFGVCPDCKELNTGIGWCNECDPGRFLREGKTSGNKEIDKLLDIKPIGEGGFAEIFSATWNNKRRNLDGPITVAIKKLKNSKNMMEAF